jgi:acetyl esterase/lipase
MPRVAERLICTLIAAIIAACAAPSAYIPDAQTAQAMDQELLAGLAAGIAEASKPPATLDQRRAAGSRLRYTEKFIPGAAGDPPVRIVIIDPPDAEAGRPGLLDMHGGGYMYGSPEDSQTAFLDALVLKLGVTAVSVDYRPAPATRYPGSLHDNYAALKWFHANAAALGVDPRRIATIGMSAGGGHAAALGILARDRGEVPILFQALLCPMLDDRTGSTVDPGARYGRFLWTREDNHNGWAALLGTAPGGNAVPQGAVPARVTDLSDLPPTYIAVGTLDLFAAESIDFAQRLKKAGVATELQVFAGGFHGFEIIVPSAAISRKAMRTLERYLVEGFGLHHSDPDSVSRP